MPMFLFCETLLVLFLVHFDFLILLISAFFSKLFNVIFLYFMFALRILVQNYEFSWSL